MELEENFREQIVGYHKKGSITKKSRVTGTRWHATGKCERQRRKGSGVRWKMGKFEEGKFKFYFRQLHFKPGKLKCPFPRRKAYLLLILLISSKIPFIC